MKLSDDPAPAEILAPLITAARTPAQREALAAELERIAALIRSVAEAQRRQQAKPATDRLTPRKRICFASTTGAIRRVWRRARS